MQDKEKIIRGLNALYESMHKNQCYACSHEFVETANEFGTNILAEAIDFIELQPQIVRCKDCKHHGNINEDYCRCLEQETNNDFYCWYGERRTDNA